jgi:hypothetical protein
MEKVERWIPLSGVVYVVLVVIGVVVARDAPEFLPTGEESAKYLVDDNGAALGSGVIWLLSVVPLVIFFGVLRARVRAVEGEQDRLSWTASTAGIGGSTLLAAATALQIQAALRADEDGEIAAGLAQLYWDQTNILFGVAAPILFGVGVLTTAAAVMHYGGLMPKWMAWVGIAFAVVAFIPPVAWVFMFFLFNLWILALSIMWTMQSDDADPDPAPSAGGSGF